MTRKLTRRQALKLLAASAAAAALSPVLPTLSGPAYPPVPRSRRDAWLLKGRAIHTVYFYEEPATTSTRLDSRARDESFLLLEEVQAPFSRHNDRWYRTPLGYVHSAWVLPVRVYAPQPFIEDVGEWGFWGEISQIHTEGRSEPHPEAHRVYRFYGGCVFRVVEAAKDELGNGWYKVVDDYPPKTERYQWILARDVRRIPRAEMEPIRPFVGDKRVEVDLSAQLLTCYEGDEVVFTTLVASGAGADHATPRGEKCVLLKQPSRHMSNVAYPGFEPEDPSDIFDLPGIPWNIFFDLEGTAIHGAYWHNDFGVPRSHGCLNVPIDAGRWIYRWIQPLGGFEDSFVQSTCRVGTPILIY